MRRQQEKNVIALEMLAECLLIVTKQVWRWPLSHWYQAAPLATLIVIATKSNLMALPMTQIDNTHAQYKKSIKSFLYSYKSDFFYLFCQKSAQNRLEPLFRPA